MRRSQGLILEEFLLGVKSLEPLPHRPHSLASETLRMLQALQAILDLAGKSLVLLVRQFRLWEGLCEQLFRRQHLSRFRVYRMPFH